MHEAHADAIKARNLLRYGVHFDSMNPGDRHTFGLLSERKRVSLAKRVARWNGKDRSRRIVIATDDAGAVIVWRMR